MKTKHFLFACLGLGILAAGLFFKEPRNIENSSVQKQEPQFVFDLKQTEHFVLKLPGPAPQLEFQKQGQGWKLTHPIEIAARAEKVEAFNDAFDRYVPEWRISGEHLFSDFDLYDPKAFQLSWKTKAGLPKKILIQSPKPESETLFFREAESAHIFTLRSDAVEDLKTLIQDPYFFAHKQLLSQPAENLKAVRMHLKEEGEVLFLEKKALKDFSPAVWHYGNGWSFRVDQDEVHSFLGILNSVRFLSVRSAVGSELLFKKPLLTMTYHYDDGTFEQWDFAKIQSTYYVRKKKSDLLFEIPSYQVEDLGVRHENFLGENPLNIPFEKLEAASLKINTSESRRAGQISRVQEMLKNLSIARVEALPEKGLAGFPESLSMLLDFQGDWQMELLFYELNSKNFKMMIRGEPYLFEVSKFDPKPLQFQSPPRDGSTQVI